MFRTIMMAVFGGFLMIYLFTGLFVFPLQARFYNPVKRTLFNAFFMSVRHISHSLGILLIDAGIVFAGIFFLPALQGLLVLFGFPLVAFLNSYVIVRVFDRYMPKEDGGEHPLDALGWLRYFLYFRQSVLSYDWGYYYACDKCFQLRIYVKKTWLYYKPGQFSDLWVQIRSICLFYQIPLW